MMAFSLFQYPEEIQGVLSLGICTIETNDITDLHMYTPIVQPVFPSQANQAYPVAASPLPLPKPEDPVEHRLQARLLRPAALRIVSNLSSR